MGRFHELGGRYLRHVWEDLGVVERLVDSLGGGF